MSDMLLDGIDFSVPIEVTFIGKNAQDYGGPRREFLQIMLREIKTKLMDDTPDGYILQQNPFHELQDHYRVAGMLFGKKTLSNFIFRIICLRGRPGVELCLYPATHPYIYHTQHTPISGYITLS
jgi:hypothetical protein